MLSKRFQPTVWFLFFLTAIQPAHLRAQQSVPEEVANQGYADLVVFNGKIVSMDDNGYNTSPGRIFEAMAIKRNRIMALGSSQHIQSLADSRTKRIDLQGRFVMPGIVEDHAHLYGNFTLGQQVGVKYPDKGISIRIQAGRDFESTRLKIENRIQDEVKKLKPGDWVVVGIMPNPQEGVSSTRTWAWVTQPDHLETKDRLDKIAPQNPVMVTAGPRANLNSAGWDMAEEYLPSFAEFSRYEMGTNFNGGEDTRKTGFVSVSQMQALQWDVWNRQTPLHLIAEMIRRDLEIGAAHGVTTFSSRVPNPKLLSAFSLLGREQALPLRFGALFESHRRPADPDVTRAFYGMTGDLTGIGNDMLWIHGVASEKWDALFPTACLGRDVEAPPHIKKREVCMKPGEMWWDTLQKALESGWRLAGIHGVGSDGARRFITMVETAMKNAGLSKEDIRNRRLTIEHAEALGKVPDVVAKLKDYGITVSVGARFLLTAPDYVDDYGPKVEPFLVPVKSLLDAGIHVTGQNEGYNNYGFMWTLLMNRKVQGKVYAPEEAVDRVVVMKMWTNWAARYVMKEKELGTLEAGKLADFLVLDRDLLTIPVDDFVNVRPQMTVMDGKVRYLGTDFAKQLGTDPVGYQYPVDYKPWGAPAARPMSMD